MTTTKLVCGDRTFKATIEVLFEGRGVGQQKLKMAEPLEVTETLSLRTLLTTAALRTFMEELDFSEAVVHISTAPALAAQHAKELEDTVEFKESEAPAATDTLWIILSLPNMIIATARAKMVSRKYDALKTQAKLQSIVFSDTQFAAMLNKKCCALSKALGKSNVEATPAGGELVMKIEEKVATYLLDMNLLKQHLQLLKEANSMLKDADKQVWDALPACTPVPSCTTSARSDSNLLCDCRAQENGSPDVHKFGFNATEFLRAFLAEWVSHKSDRTYRVRLLKQILDAAKHEGAFDSTWWTPDKLQTKLKKMARGLKQPASSQPGAGAGAASAGGSPEAL